MQDGDDQVDQAGLVQHVQQNGRVVESHPEQDVPDQRRNQARRAVHHPVAEKVVVPHGFRPGADFLQKRNDQAAEQNRRRIGDDEYAQDNDCLDSQIDIRFAPSGFGQPAGYRVVRLFHMFTMSIGPMTKIRKSRSVAKPNRMRFGKTPEGKKGPAVTYSMKNQKAVTQRSAAGPYGRAGAFEKERRRPQDTHTHVKVD